MQKRKHISSKRVLEILELELNDESDSKDSEILECIEIAS